MSSKGIIPNLRPDIKTSPLGSDQISKLKFEAQKRRQIQASSSYGIHQVLPLHIKLGTNILNNNSTVKKYDESSFMLDDDAHCHNFSETTPTPPSDIISNNKNKSQQPPESFNNFKSVVLRRKQTDCDYYPYLGLYLESKKISDQSDVATTSQTNISSTSIDQPSSKLARGNNIPVDIKCTNNTDDKIMEIVSNSVTKNILNVDDNNHELTDNCTKTDLAVELNDHMANKTKISSSDEIFEELPSNKAEFFPNGMCPRAIVDEICPQIVPKVSPSLYKDNTIIDEFLMEPPLESLSSIKIITTNENDRTDIDTGDVATTIKFGPIDNTRYDEKTVENTTMNMIISSTNLHDSTNINSNNTKMDDNLLANETNEDSTVIDLSKISPIQPEKSIYVEDITKNDEITKFSELLENNQPNPMGTINMEELLNETSPLNDKELEQALNFFSAECKDNNSAINNVNNEGATSDLLNDCFSMVMRGQPAQSTCKATKPFTKSVSKNTANNKARTVPSNRNKRSGSAKTNNNSAKKSQNTSTQNKRSSLASNAIRNNTPNIPLDTLNDQVLINRQQTLTPLLSNLTANSANNNPARLSSNGHNDTATINNYFNQLNNSQQEPHFECVNATDINSFQMLLSQGVLPEQLQNLPIIQPNTLMKNRGDTNSNLVSYTTHFIKDLNEIFKNDINGQYIQLRNGINILATNENYQLYNYLKQLIFVIVTKHQSGVLHVHEIRRLVDVLDSQIRVPHLGIDNDKKIIYGHILSILTSYCNGLESILQNLPSSAPPNRNNPSVEIMPTPQKNIPPVITTDGQSHHNPRFELTNTTEVNVTSVPNPQNYMNNMMGNQPLSYVTNNIRQNVSNPANILNNNYPIGVNQQSQIFCNNNNNNNNNNGTSSNLLNQPTFNNNHIPNQNPMQTSMLPLDTVTARPNSIGFNAPISTQQQQHVYINNHAQKPQNVQRLINVPSNGVHTSQQYTSTHAPNITSIDIADYPRPTGVFINGVNPQQPLVNVNDNDARHTSSKTYYTNVNNNDNLIGMNEYYHNPIKLLSSQNNQNNNMSQYTMCAPNNEIVEVADNRNGRGNKVFIIPSNNGNERNYPLQHQQIHNQQTQFVIPQLQSNQNPQYMPTNTNTIALPSNAIVINQQQQHHQNLDPSDHYRLQCSLKEEVDKEFINRMNVNKFDLQTTIMNQQSNINPIQNSFTTAPRPQPIIRNNATSRGIVNGISFPNGDDVQVLQISSSMWHKIHSQFEIQIQQKLENDGNLMENNFFIYQTNLKSKLEAFVCDQSCPFIERIPNFSQMIAHPELQSAIRSGRYELPFTMMDRFLALINLLAVNLLICTAKKYDCIQLHTLYIECESYLNTLIKICTDRSDIPYLEPFFNHIFLKIRCLIQKRMCENKIVIFKAISNANNTNNEQYYLYTYLAYVSLLHSDLISFTKQYCDMAAQYWNQANSLAQTIKPQIDFMNYFLPKLEVTASLVFISHFLYVIIIICAYHSK